MDRTLASGSVSGRYVDRNLPSGQPGTLLVAKDRNLVQEEICNLLVGFGVSLDPDNEQQLYELVQQLLGDIALDIADVSGEIETASRTYMSYPVGVPFPVSRYAGGDVPTGDNFIILSRDNSQPNEIHSFNVGKMVGIAGVYASAHVYYTTGVIDDPNSPLYNQTVDLINSLEIYSGSGWANSPSVLGATTSPGFYQNQFQGHWVRATGSFVSTGSGANIFRFTGSSASPQYQDSGYVGITTGSNGNIRTGGQTRQDTFGLLYYMRIK